MVRRLEKFGRSLVLGRHVCVYYRDIQTHNNSVMEELFFWKGIQIMTILRVRNPDGVHIVVTGLEGERYVYGGDIGSDVMVDFKRNGFIVDTHWTLFKDIILLAAACFGAYLVLG